MKHMSKHTVVEHLVSHHSPQRTESPGIPIRISLIWSSLHFLAFSSIKRYFCFMRRSSVENKEGQVGAQHPRHQEKTWRLLFVSPLYLFDVTRLQQPLEWIVHDKELTFFQKREMSNCLFLTCVRETSKDTLEALSNLAVLAHLGAFFKMGATFLVWAAMRAPTLFWKATRLFIRLHLTFLFVRYFILLWMDFHCKLLFYPIIMDIRSRLNNENECWSFVCCEAVSV